MNEKITLGCIKIMSKLMQRPLASVFQDRPSTSKSPNLDAIFTKLKNNDYKSMDSWYSEVISFFKRAKDDSGKDLMTPLCAEDMIEWTQKRKNKLLNALEPKTWSKTFKHHYEKVIEVMEEAPDDLQEISLRIQAEEGDPVFLPFSPSEIESLGKAIAMVKDDNTMKGIITIAQAMNESSIRISTDDEVTFELNKCKPQTLYTMSNYIRKRLDREGMTYPD